MNKQTAQLMAITGLIASSVEGPYSGLDFHIPSHPKRLGTTVCCSVCGASGATLYKVGEDRICRKCRDDTAKIKGGI